MSLRDLDIDGVGKAVYRHCTSPKALYVTLVERWWFLALTCFLGIAIGCLIIKTSTPQFAAHGRMLVYQKLPTFMDDATRVPDPKAYDSLFATHVQLIGSPMIVEKAVTDFGLDKLDEIDELHAKHRSLGGKTVAGMICENLKVGRAGSGDADGAFVLSVEFKHKSAKECPIVVDAILKTYRAYVNDSMLDDQNKAVELLGTFKKQLEGDVTEKANRWRSFLQESKGIWDETTKVNSHQLRAAALDEELTRLEIDRKSVESRVNVLEQSKTLPPIQRLALVDDLHLPRLEILVSLAGDNNVGSLQQVYPQLQEAASAQYDDLLDKLVELSSISRNVGTSHPQYTDALAEVELLKKELQRVEPNGPVKTKKLSPADLVAAYEVLLREELGTLDQRISFLQQRVKKEVDAAKSLKDFSIRADQLKDEYERANEVSGALVDRMQKQTMLSQFGSYIVEVVEQPGKGQLVWPKKPIVLMLCTLCGLFLGVVGALVLDLIEVSPLRNLFGRMPSWLIRDRWPSSGAPAG